MEIPKKIRIIGLSSIFIFLALVSLANVNEHAALEKISLCNQMQGDLVRNTFDSGLKSLQAKAFYVYDFTKGEALRASNERTPLPLASLTKLMTARLVLQEKSLTDLYTVKAADLTADGSTGFADGESFQIGDILRAALAASSNDAATILERSAGLSDSDFVQAMNSEALKLGLPNLSFGNPTGLDSKDNIATAFGSAHDVLMLLYRDYTDFKGVMSISVLPESTIASTDGKKIKLKNTNLVIDKLPLLLASKTGYTDIAGGNLAILWQESGSDVVGAAVLGSTTNGRFTDMVSIHDASDNYIAGQKLLPSSCKQK